VGYKFNRISVAKGPKRSKEVSKKVKNPRKKDHV